MELFLHEGISLPSEFTLFVSIPSPNAGNVGLMSIDCLLSSLSMRRIGCIESKYLIPITGYEEYPAGGTTVLCMPLEVYLFTGNDHIVLFHQRSIPTDGKMKTFMEDYLQLLRTLHFNSLVFISSESITCMPDSFVHG